MRALTIILAFLALLLTPAWADVVNSNTGSLVQLQNAPAATYTSALQSNNYGNAATCLVSITNLGASATLTVTIQGWDTASAQPYTILASAGLNSVGNTVLQVGPGLTAATNTVANAYLPANWNVKAVVGTAAVTATIGCSVM